MPRQIAHYCHTKNLRIHGGSSSLQVSTQPEAVPFNSDAQSRRGADLRAARFLRSDGFS
jgi:hypothetical protein